MLDKSEKIVIKFRRRKIPPHTRMVDAHIPQENIIMLQVFFCEKLEGFRKKLFTVNITLASINNKKVFLFSLIKMTSKKKFCISYFLFKNTSFQKEN